MLYFILRIVYINIFKNYNSTYSNWVYTILINGFVIKYNIFLKIDFIFSIEYLYFFFIIVNYFWELCFLIFIKVKDLDLYLEFRFLEKENNMKV